VVVQCQLRIYFYVIRQHIYFNNKEGFLCLLLNVVEIRGTRYNKLCVYEFENKFKTNIFTTQAGINRPFQQHFNYIVN
jgi:hypothetical protein